MRILLLLCAAWSVTKADDAEAVVVEAEKDKKSVSPSTRFLGGSALAPAALGFGAGVVGSLLVGKLLEESQRNKCGQAPFRGRRDNTQTRFLPGLFGGGKKCTPNFNQHQQSGYQQPQPHGYQPPRQNGYQPQHGYQPSQPHGYQPANGYQPAQQQGYQPAQQQGYQPASSGYHQPSVYTPQNPVYHQPTSGYQQPTSGYQQPTSGYQQPTSVYKQPTSGYQQPTSGLIVHSPGYHQATPSYQTPTSVYQHPNTGYAREQQHAHNQFSATNTYSPTVAPHISTHNNSPHLSSGSNFSGIIARKLPKGDDSKVNFG